MFMDSLYILTPLELSIFERRIFNKLVVDFYVILLYNDDVVDGGWAKLFWFFLKYSKWLSKRNQGQALRGELGLPRTRKI